jgi:hypothetical protein
VTPNSDMVRVLRRVGQRVFVEFFREFSDDSLSSADVVALLPHRYKLSSRRTQTTAARWIISHGFATDALELIAGSTKADDATSRGARHLLGGR